MLRQRRIRVGRQLLSHSRLQGRHLLGGSSGDGFGTHMPGFSPLFDIAPNRRQTDSQHSYNLAARNPLIHCLQHVFS